LIVCTYYFYLFLFVVPEQILGKYKREILKLQKELQLSRLIVADKSASQERNALDEMVKKSKTNKHPAKKKDSKAKSRMKIQRTDSSDDSSLEESEDVVKEKAKAPAKARKQNDTQPTAKKKTKLSKDNAKARKPDDTQSTAKKKTKLSKDNVEDEDEDIKEDSFNILEFRWATNEWKDGYLLVDFKDGKEASKMAIKPLLYDFPEKVLGFMWCKYSDSELTMRYIEKCAKAQVSYSGQREKCVPGFKNLSTYAIENKLTDSYFCIQQRPAWDKDVRKRPPPEPLKRPKIVAGEWNTMNKGCNNTSMASPRHEVDVCPENLDSEMEAIAGEEIGCLKGSIEDMGGEEVEREESGINRLLRMESREDGEAVVGGELRVAEVDALMVDEVEPEVAEDESEDDSGDDKKGEVPPICVTVNHDWEEFPSGRWVEEGRILHGQRCIGTRNSTICDRKFVEKAFGGRGQNHTDDLFYPTAAHPAWGCKRCKRAMCNECKVYYVGHQRMESPARQGRGGK
jgi:hypothetical protein